MSQEVKKAASGAVWIFIAQLSLTLSSYGVMVILARELGPVMYGAYGLIYSVLVGVEQIGRLGVPQAAGKLIAEHGGDTLDLQRTALTLTGIVYLSLFAAFWFLSPVLANLFNLDGKADLFRLASLDIPFFGFYMMCRHIINGQRRFKLESTAVIVYSFAKAAGIAVLFFVGVSISGAFIVNIASSIVGVAFLLFCMQSGSLRLSLVDARVILSPAMSIALLSLGSQVLLNLDFWMLGALSENLREGVVGLYTAASSVAKIPNIIFFVMMAVLIPSISHALSIGDEGLAQKYVRGATEFLVLLVLPGCVLIAIEAEGVMKIIYGENFTGGAEYLSVLIFAFGFLYTTLMTFSGILIAMGRSLIAANTTLLIIPAMLICGVILIQWLGAIGAAITATFAIGTCVGVFAYFIHRRMGKMMFLITILKVFSATALMAFAARQVPSSGLLLIVEGILIFAMYLLLLGLMGAVKWKDLMIFIPGSKPKPS